jgi:hypothetical protein
MISTVVALGNSGINWKPRRLTIGVNEYLMWGRQAEVMVLVNAPHKFSLYEMNLIKQHKGKVMTNSPGQWSKYFPQAELLKHMGQFNLRVQKGRIYSSSTSPMIAISYAMTQGATEIILYGVDFKNHSKYKEGTKHGDHEVGIYKRFFVSCEKLGTKIYLGEWGTAFDGHLWKYVDHVESSRTGHEFMMKLQ